MANKRRPYRSEFKAEAVQLVLTAGVSVTKAATDLGIPKSVLSKWVSLAREAAMPGALSVVEREELRRLKKENEILKKERAILAKAAVHSCRQRNTSL